MSAQFDDGKEEGALRTIGEVAAALGIKAHVLRYWEQQFPMLEPLKRSGGRRYYRPEDVELLERIDRLVNREGYTLKGARKALSGKQTVAGAGQDGQLTETDDAKPTLPESPDLPADGGVDAFFGRTNPEADTDAAPAEEADDTVLEATAELVAELKAIRGRLAEAIGV